jgi:hypothetical protein
VIEEVAIAQGMVKQAVQESAEKLKTHISVETFEGIAQQETKETKNITTPRETFQKFMEA